ncbi:hydroxymethylglutaryl-CoA reductase, degradative [Saccharicrinis sp. 156]|uniref:hydroxymethylglutaryl-CoA reductase, degradative n=1 Tax=Saccharicrinis sp. 156 TaxID=3417574 RepID=UPI003D34C5BC
MIQGFSKLSQEEKIDVLLKKFNLPSSIKEVLNSHLHKELQEVYNQFSENTISNFYLPYGIAPNFIINEKEYAIPMAIEESSVVAAASKAAKFWSKHGGFRTHVISTTKVGQLFFTTDWKLNALQECLPALEIALKESVYDLTQNMSRRGGGIVGMVVNQETDVDERCFSLQISFETADSMGANFINSCLERMGAQLCTILKAKDKNKQVEITMAILSNYTPDCIVECTLSCPIDSLKAYSGDYSPQEFAHRFQQAVLLAQHNISRAVTHNKGIMNGVDAVVLATGNDYRAIEAGAHAYAAKSGKYSSLTQIKIEDEVFTYTLTLPMALGTVGGLTKVHPLAKLSLALLANPSAPELMQIIAAAGMANNFSALAALVTSGIQKGHMKMHLSNILFTFNASDDEKEKAENYFISRTVSHSAVKQFLESERQENQKK